MVESPVPLILLGVGADSDVGAASAAGCSGDVRFGLWRPPGDGGGGGCLGAANCGALAGGCA